MSYQVIVTTLVKPDLTVGSSPTPLVRDKTGTKSGDCSRCSPSLRSPFWPLQRLQDPPTPPDRRLQPLSLQLCRTKWCLQRLYELPAPVNTPLVDDEAPPGRAKTKTTSQGQGESGVLGPPWNGRGLWRAGEDADGRVWHSVQTRTCWRESAIPTSRHKPKMALPNPDPLRAR